MEKITPRIDLAFKKIFGVEENKDLLISLVNSIVSQEDQVKDLTLLNPYNPKNFKEDKLSILDIKAEGEDGKRFNIEIQITDEADYDKRALYYWGKLYTEQLQSGDEYSKLSKAIGIHILNFTSILETPQYHNVFVLTEKDLGLRFFTDIELHTIELNKFVAGVDKELSELVKRIKTSLDIWAAFLTRHDLLKKNDLPPSLNTPALKKALDTLDIMNFDCEEREAYEERLKWFRVEANTLKKYENKGFEQGLEQGLEKGLEKGREERTVEIARAMQSKGMDLETISSITGLALEALQKELN